MSRLDAIMREPVTLSCIRTRDGYEVACVGRGGLFHFRVNRRWYGSAMQAARDEATRLGLTVVAEVNA